MLLDFAVMSVLLVVAHLLRFWVRPLQTWYVPTPIIAGFLGLALGPEGLDRLPFAAPAAGQLSLADYPQHLVVLLFGTLFMGHRPSSGSFQSNMRRVGDTFCFNLASEIGQYGAALLVGLTALAWLLPDLDSRFALMMPAGFAGGHGTAAAIGGILAKHGWSEALPIGYTFATIGLLAGVFGGVALVNLGTRFRWARLVRAAHELPEGLRRGLLTDGPELGRETASPIAIDPLAWHAALVFVTYGAAIGLYRLGAAHLPSPYNELPKFALAMLFGAAMQWTFERLGVGKFVDRRTVVRIGSTAADFLIAFAITSIKPSVLREYAGPLALMSLVGLVYAFGIFWFVGRRIYHNFWFERSIFVYGWNTGVVGTGVTLLRVVDPHAHSAALEDFGRAYVAIAPIEIALIILVPTLVAAGHALPTALALTACAVGLIVVSARAIGWFTADPRALRVGEPKQPEDATA